MAIVTVGVEWINDFHKDACSQNQLVYMNTHAEGFLNSMVSKGHASVFDWGDDNAWETDFRNPSSGGGGDALNWSDNVNFCYFADHGGNWSNILHIAFFPKVPQSDVSGIFGHVEAQGKESPSGWYSTSATEP